MRRVVLAFAVCVALVTSGARADDAVHFALSGCDYVEVVARVAPSVVAPLVPSDFVLAHGTDGLALVNLGGADCTDAASGDVTGAASFGWLLVQVQAPADATLRGSGIRVYFYRLQHFVIPGDVYQHVADGAGADQIAVDGIDASIAPALSQLAIDTGDTQHGAIVPVSPMAGPPIGPTRWREFHAVDGGYATLEATLHPGAGAGNLAGVVQPADGSVAASVLGPVNAGRALYGAGFAVEDAFMTVLPKPA
jgi:hypothetical protein